MAFEWLNWSNFKLGLAGSVDLVTGLPAQAARAVGAPEVVVDVAEAPQTHFSGTEYLNQVHQDPSLSDSQYIDAHADEAKSGQLDDFINADTTGVIDNGGLSTAADKTVQQVASTGTTVLVVAAVALSLAGGAYLVWRLT